MQRRGGWMSKIAERMWGAGMSAPPCTAGLLHRLCLPPVEQASILCGLQQCASAIQPSQFEGGMLAIGNSMAISNRDMGLPDAWRLEPPRELLHLKHHPAAAVVAAQTVLAQEQVWLCPGSAVHSLLQTHQRLS